MHEAVIPTVSVITPLHNSSRYIEETLDSLCNQTYCNWESILIDDGSIDDTAQKIQPYLKDPRFTYIKQDNRGIAGARNTGIQAARGTWICLLDHDDRWVTTKLEKQLAFALAGDFDIVSTDAIVVKGASRMLYSQLFPKDLIAELELSDKDKSMDLFRLLIQCNFLCASSVMIRKLLFDQRGLLDPAAAPADDHEMWLRCMPEAKIGYLNEPLIEYVMHEHNYSHDEVRMAEKVIYTLFKHRGKYLNDERRLRQFDKALGLQYKFLFQRLLSNRRYASVFSEAFILLTKGQCGLRLVFRSDLPGLLLRMPYYKFKSLLTTPSRIL